MRYEVVIYDEGFGVFLVHPPMASVLLSASVERFSVSRMRDFYHIFLLTYTSEKQIYNRTQRACSHLVQIQSLNGQNYENLYDNNKIHSVCSYIGIATYGIILDFIILTGFSIIFIIYKVAENKHNSNFSHCLFCQKLNF